MDGITQGILGGVIAQLGFRQRIGRDATWAAGAAAVVPDLDVLVTPLLELLGADPGPLGRAVIHRGYSHSLLVAPLIALPLALAWWALRRRWGARATRFGMLYSLMLLAVLSQPLLDVCTSYGTQILLPFDSHRYALDAIPIVDIFYTPALILTLLSCYLLRQRCGEQRTRRMTLWVGWAGLLLTTAYVGAGRLAHDSVIARGRAALAGECLERIEAYPMIPSILVWRVVARFADGWSATRMHLLGGTPRQRRVEDADGPWVQRANALPEVSTFRWFTNGMVRFATAEAPDGAPVVELHDMRYSMHPEGTEALWKLRIRFDPDGRAQEVVFDHVRDRRGDMGEFVRGVWHDTWRP